mmetsp:Transcript_6927/g.17240  ORF Transcript_6927/g.17240 Transcript_6927/m.17240 type:complete len:234 (+) Transcript_6927:2156-2857(+)
MGCPSGPSCTSWPLPRGVSGSPTARNTAAAAAAAGAAAAASATAAAAPTSSSCRFASCLRSSRSSVTSARSVSQAVHTARVDTCGALTPSSSTAVSMRFTPRAPPAPTATAEISPATKMTCAPRAYTPGGGRTSGPSAVGRLGTPASPAKSFCSSWTAMDILTASMRCEENAAPARALSACASARRRPSMAFTSSRMACSSRSNALVRSIWSDSASLRSTSCCALNGDDLMIG